MSDSKMKQTRWEWVEDPQNGGYSGLFTEDGDDVVVPQCANDGDDGRAWFEEISDADRDLIAAAPEMLADYKRIVAVASVRADTGSVSYLLERLCHCREIAIAAIAKAKGQ